MLIEKVRVVHVIARLNIGGTARYLSELLPELQKENFNTLLVVGRVQTGEVEDSILTSLNFRRIETLGRRINLVNDIRAYFEIRKVVKDFNPKLIHSHTFKAGLLCRMMFLRIPKVHTYHGHLLTDPEFSKVNKVIVKIEKKLARFTHKIIVTGQQVSEDLLIQGIGTVKKYVSIPGENTINNLIPRDEARAKLGLDGEFTILWMARVAPVKNPKLLLEIARLMPECTFLLAGDGVELDWIRTKAPSNLKILGFVQPQEVLLGADLFLSTSLNEGVPYSILEAQSAGIPTVAVNAGALSEIISDGVTGFLVEPVAEKIITKILEIKNSTELRLHLGLQAKRQSVANKSAKSIGLHHIEIYKDVLDLN